MPSTKTEATHVQLGSEQQSWKKYGSYSVPVNPDEDDRATEIHLCSFGRPHMRAFHYAWWSFFIAFFIWFAITPLLPQIQSDLKLTNDEVWNSTIASFSGTIFVRLLLGPLCDKFGARVPFSIMLCIASIATACTGFVNSATGLTILRAFIGIAGGSFVTCQYWTSDMFAKDIVGTANGIVAGWGNLGFGMTQLIVGLILYPIFQLIYKGDAEKAWRTVPVIPAAFAFTTGILLYLYTDDSPKGNYSELKHRGLKPDVSMKDSFKSACVNYNTWLLFVQYACCFGVELAISNAASLYFKQEFDLTTASAAAIASLFGWLNLFARGLGGLWSDQANLMYQMPGRLWVQTILLASEGILIFVFANTKTLSGAIVVLVFFSFFVQSAEGTTMAISPYVDPLNTGSVTGIIGAGGNVGAVCYGLTFRQMKSYHSALTVMGATALASSVLSLFIMIEGHRGVILNRMETKQDKEVQDEEG